MNVHNNARLTPKDREAVAKWCALRRDHPSLGECDIPFVAAICLPSFRAQGKLSAVPPFGHQIEDLNGPRGAGAAPARLLACSVRVL